MGVIGTKTAGHTINQKVRKTSHIITRLLQLTILSNNSKTVTYVKELKYLLIAKEQCKTIKSYQIHILKRTEDELKPWTKD